MMVWIKKLIAKCYLCGHEWIPKTDNPLHCAKCHSRLWNGTTIKTSKRKGTK